MSHTNGHTLQIKVQEPPTWSGGPQISRLTEKMMEIAVDPSAWFSPLLYGYFMSFFEANYQEEYDRLVRARQQLVRVPRAPTASAPTKSADEYKGSVTGLASIMEIQAVCCSTGTLGPRAPAHLQARTLPQ